MSTDPQLLDENQKQRILLEEQYRSEIKRKLEGEEPSGSGKKLVLFFNSNLGLWLLSTVLIGSISFLYNFYLTWEEKLEKQQQEARNRASKNATMITTLLPHLTSKEKKQIDMAIAITSYLKEQGELPGELEAALVKIVNQDVPIATATPDQIEQINAAAKVIDAKPGNNAGANADNTTINNLASDLPARVYIQIPNEDKRALAKDFQIKLQDNGFLSPGVENISGKAKAPNITEVRYYRDEEQAEAMKVISLLKSINGLKVNNNPVRVTGNARPRHYEIWFSN